MFAGPRCGLRSRSRTTAAGVGIAAALLVSIAAVPATAGPGAPGIGGVDWEGTQVVLRQVNDLDALGTGHTLVGQAVDFVTSDPRLACLNGTSLAVYSRSGDGDTPLTFSTVGSATTCVTAAFEAVRDAPTEMGLACLTNECVGDMAAFRVGQAAQAAQYQSNAAVQRVNSVPVQGENAAAIGKTLSTPLQMAGQLLGQYDSLYGLYEAQFSASLTNAEANMVLNVAGTRVGVSSPLRIDASNAVGCLVDGCPVVTYTIDPSADGPDDEDPEAKRDPSVSPAKFVYWTGITPTWDNTGNKHGVHGAVIYNLWRLNSRVSDTDDFYATSQNASVTPNDKSRVTKVWTKLYAEGSQARIIEASPIAMTQKGQGETITLSATLNGNVSAKRDGTGGEVGGSFGLSRSYTRPEANSGGGLDSALSHFASWETGDNGSGYTKDAVAVTSWTKPINSGISWYWDAAAWKCDDPCGW